MVITDKIDYWPLHDSGASGDAISNDETLMPYVDPETNELLDLLRHRKAAMNCGPHLPPFNPGSPPITLAFIWSCDTAPIAQQYAAALLYPLTNEYLYGDFYPGLFDWWSWVFWTGGAPIEDQALITFHGSQKLHLSKETTDTFYHYMEQGFDVFWARRRTWNLLHPDHPEIPQDFDTSWMQINGDFFTRLHGVYKRLDPDPNSGWPTDWYYQLG